MGGIIAALAVLAVVAIVVINSGLFAATDIQIRGSEHVTKHDAIQLIDLPENTSLFNVNPDQITEGLKQNPWVSGVDVQRQFPIRSSSRRRNARLSQSPTLAPTILPGRLGTMTRGLHRCLPRLMLTTRTTSP